MVISAPPLTRRPHRPPILTAAWPACFWALAARVRESADFLVRPQDGTATFFDPDGGTILDLHDEGDVIGFCNRIYEKGGVMIPVGIESAVVMEMLLGEGRGGPGGRNLF